MFAQESVMGIKKEREAFDVYFKEKYPELYKDVFDEDGDDRAIIGYSFAWSAWQTAKAQVVPEGFVLVNKKDLARVLNCVTDDWLVDTDSFEEFKKIKSLVQDEVNAMIEAQEQKG